MFITGKRILVCAGILISLGSQSQPAIALVQEIGGVKVYRDEKKSNLFYYMPFDYKLVTDSKGVPDLALVQMRYTGTSASGDAGTIRFHNLLQFRVAVDPAQQNLVAQLKTELKKQVAQPELRPLPVRKFSSVVVFAGLSDTTIMDDSVRFVPANADLTDESSDSNNSFWTDRTITLRLGNEDAQIVETAFRNKSSAISFSYALFTIFSETAPGELQVSANPRLRKKIRDYFFEGIKNTRDSTLRVTMVKADAINLQGDPGQSESLIQKIDINERLPARYPLFDVYCYDFNNALRPDLYAKKIEIRATSLNGADVITSFSFLQSQPERYSKSIRFPYAIRFDKPFFYRVTEITNDGDAIFTEWKKKSEWNEILDITSPPEKVVRPVEPDID